MTVSFDEKKIDAIFAHLDQCHLPGAAVGIAIGGRPVYRKGFGLASMELPVVLSPTIRMRIGSITKHFASLAYLLLCEQRKASLDDPVGKYLPELHRVTHPITMRQLMGHLSGLRDVFDIVWQFSGTECLIRSDALLEMYREIDDVNAAPDTTWIYNNGGYLMLSTVIERIAGHSLEDVLRERIFEPAGMYATQLHRWDGSFAANLATAHMTRLSDVFEKSYFFGTAFAGEGGMISTVDDMLRWLIHMDAPRVGSSATWRTLKTPLTLPNGTSTGYGLGLYAGEYRGIETLSHSGGGMGANAQMLKVPRARLDIIVMVNRGDEWAVFLTEKVLDACLPELQPVEPNSSRAMAHGVFRSPQSGRVIQLFDQNGQQIAAINGIDIPVAEENGMLRPTGMARNSKRFLKLISDPERPASVHFDDYGELDELIRLSPVSTPDASAIEGRYESRSTATQAIVCATAQGVQLKTAGRFGSVVFDLESLADNLWRARSRGYRYFGGVLFFDREHRTFQFSSDRTRLLLFRRVE